MLVHDKVKELQKFFSPELFSEIKSIPRWTFIKGSLSYVIHCVAMILEKRYVLGMTDQLKPFVIKLLYTLHWIVTEAYKECSKPKDEGLDLTDIELFLHMCIPFLSNLNESDLTHSLQSGMHLWQPLWNNIPPRDTLLALPVIKPKDHSTFTSGKEEIPTFYTTATYFDIALVKVMMVDHWTLYGYRWGLQYLQNHFQNILFKLGFDCENCEVIKAINRFTHRKSVLLTMDSQGEMKPADIFSNSDPTAFPPLSETVPESLKMYVDKEGALRTEFLLQLIEKLVKNPNIHQLSGSLLFVHSQIVEISLDDQNIFKMLLKHFSPLLYCQVKIMQLFGCERNCGIGIRGKAENYRYLAHSYLKRIIYADKEKAEEWFINFVATEKVEDSLHLLHALFGICESSPHQQIGKSTLRLLIDDDGQSQQQEKYLENRASNEKNIIEWVTPSLIKFIFLKWKKEKSSNHMEMFTLAHHFIQFVQVKHPMIFRKLIMSGLLDSFTKTTNPPTATSQDSFNARVFSNGSSLNGSSSPSNENTASGGGGGGKKWRRGGEILKMMHAKQKTEDVEVSFATLPRNTTQSSQNASSVFSTSLPRNFSMSDDSKSPKGGAQIRTKWGKSTNMHGLLAGVQQLRCLFDLMSPGVLPDELIVGALLDLEAPVVSRASYLMELAYFVNKCNKEDWPMLMELMKSGHIKTSIHELTATKLQAGRLFYKWGIVIGRKLEDMLNEDRMSLEDLSKPVNREKVNFLYQGDIGSVSSYCPQSLRFVACHLLKEITAYLRERHASLIAAQIPSDNDSPMTFHREISHSSSAASSRRPKQSIASALSKKIIEVKRKKSSVNLLVGSASNPDGRDSPSSSPSPNRHIPARKKSTSNVFRSRSPKFGRRYSKQTSRLPLEDQNIDSLLVDSEETSEFPWLSVIIDMNRSINFLCVHSTTQCPEDCPLEQVKSCNTLLHALKLLYEPGRLDDKELDHVDSTHAQKKDVVYEYITKQVGSFYHVPYSVLCKGAFVMDNQQLSDIVAASWEVLLYPDEQLKSAAACLFLVAASKMEATVSTFLTKELTCSGDIDRAKAIQRYEVLWNCRKTVYNHLEETSKTALKVPFPKIEYTVPSRFIGQQPDPEQLPDAPWNPDEQAFNELDVSDDEVSLYFHDSEKQKKIKQERRLKKLKRMREDFPITSVPLNLDASVETWMVEEIADENTPKETNAMACQIATAHQPFFPPAMNVGILRIIPLLDDASITTINSQSVGDLAHSLVWYCLVDDPQTFFRRFFEKITNKNKQEELILLLRKLLFHIPKLPGNAAVILFNNLIGLISFYERTNDKAQRMLYHDKIAEIMPLLWQIVPSVDKLYFNEMKQILRREHIDVSSQLVLVSVAGINCAGECNGGINGAEGLNNGIDVAGECNDDVTAECNGAINVASECND
ncbi:protein unc-80 homolog [Clytia hemisphaerica]